MSIFKRSRPAHALPSTPPEIGHGEMRTSEAECWEAIRAGNIRRFEALLHEVYAPLCVAAQRITGSADVAEDIVTEVLAGLWHQRERVVPMSSVQAYLYRAVRNRALNVVRATRRARHVSIDEALDVPDMASATGVDESRLSLMDHAIEQAIVRLSPRARAVFVLSREQQLSHQEISSVTGLSVQAVAVHLSRALQQIRLAIEPYI